MTRDQEELDRLLAKGQLSGAQKERVLGNILESNRVKHVARRPRFYALWAMATAGAAALFFVSVLSSNSGLGLRVSDDFRGKGVGTSKPFIEAGCAEACRLGSTLVFAFDNLEIPLYFAAVAKTQKTTKLWFFPSDTEVMPLLDVSQERQILKRGIVLDKKHGRGQYSVDMILSKRRLDRSEILSILDKENSKDIVYRKTQVLEVLP